ncbi:hypothetical protein [Actinoplanes regularis]|uniref:hypothetical protein n=1 Tax=Actinoplanes regularis TaxID=52697 RepID=UPI00255791B5|nr:hypothetical protein [Actinoplanes regularis]
MQGGSTIAWAANWRTVRGWLAQVALLATMASVYDHFVEGMAWLRALRAGLFFGLFTQALISLVDAVYWYRARAPR